MVNTAVDTFHGYGDAKVYGKYGIGIQPAPVGAQTSTTTRELSYRFYSHFHPYVTELVRRLIEGSVRGLQATDTEYADNPDGTLKVLPNSVLAALTADVTVIDPGNKQRTIQKGSQLRLFDDAFVLLPAIGNKQAKLPGDMVVTEPRGLRVTIAAVKETIEFGAEIRLINSATAALPDGSQATLPANTSLTLIGCKPLPRLYDRIFSASSYDPSSLVRLPYPVKDLDFTSGGAYAVYNWELFYHVPITIAIHLSKNQRYEEAMRWFHFVFDPTDDSDGPTPERFWKVKPFQFTDVKLVEELLINLSTGADPALRQETINSIGAWKDSPFRPHVVARFRHTAYMFKAVMAYMDNLIAWGDSLFRQDTGESINEATQLYVLAANILGPRPQAVPKKGSVRPQTYDNLKKDLSEFGNALVKLEADIPFDILPHPNDAANLDQFTSTLRSIGNALYFSVPRNDKLLGYWDTVADRLFKIRNSLNILGVFRQLPLFEPPIDPALLAKAAAAGLDVGAIISGANQPLPLARFQTLIQRSSEVCQEVKSMGANLLSAIEKEDNEALAILRAKHERAVLGLAEVVRYAQLQDAIKTREGLVKSLVSAIQRYTYYERLLGRQESEIQVPELDALDADNLGKKQFKQGEPELGLRDIEVDIAQDLGASGGKMISSHEASEMNLLDQARALQFAAAAYDLVGSALSLIPQIGGKVQPMGGGADVTFGGEQLSKMYSLMASSIRIGADQLSYEAGKTAKIGSYARREQEWVFQSNLAAGEITQTFKQLRAAQIREAIAEREWKNHQQQIKNAEEIERFLNEEGAVKAGKKSNKALYTWMKREVKGLYGQVFQLAFDIARKAERALQHELGDPNLSFLQFGYISGKEGLLAGEKLYLDVKRMEMAYHDLNRREYEMTKHVSLLQLNPVALLQLRATGRCAAFLPEELFDMDGPGHYFRRIKSVALSVPCVTGPYTGVNCALSLLKSSIRKSPLLRDGAYARDGAEDDRFSDHFGGLQSIVTSTGQNDSGLFETNLRDERYLPFEGSGVISEWQLELPDDVRQFDYDSIADVILHIRYTAREGGGLLRNGAVANFNERIAEAQAAGSTRLFSARREFPTEWSKFKSVQISGATKAAELTLTWREEHYPFWSRGRVEVAKRVDLFAEVTENTKNEVGFSSELDNAGELDSTAKDKLVKAPALPGLLVGKLDKVPLPKPIHSASEEKFTIFFDDNSMGDLWIALSWGKSD
jgi:receptor-binding and translocation channel-forming TcA subunit of Tc toxin